MVRLLVASMIRGRGVVRRAPSRLIDLSPNKKNLIDSFFHSLYWRTTHP